MDFKIHRVYTGRIGSNAYFVVDGEVRAAVIDPGLGNAVREFADKNGWKIELCLLTHGHFDHIGACAALQSSGVKIGVSEKDADKLYTDNNLGGEFGLTTEKLRADYTFSDGEEIDFHGFVFRVMATPGHSEGSVCFLTEKGIFSGDTLFNGSIGRTDFYDGSEEKIHDSLKKLLAVREDAAVWPGHGLPTTLKREREENPYL